MAGRIVSLLLLLLLLLLPIISFAIARAPVDAAPVYVGDLVSLIEVIKQTSSVAVWGSSFFAWIEGGRGFGCERRLWLLLVLRFFRSSTTHALYMGRVRGDWILLHPYAIRSPTHGLPPLVTVAWEGVYVKELIKSKRRKPKKRTRVEI